MNAANITTKFENLGAKVDVAVRRRVQFPRDLPVWKFMSKERLRRLRTVPERFSVDVDEDGKDERFVIVVNRDAEPELDFSVLDVQPDDRHLLLMIRDAAKSGDVQKFLCGHDERHWFVAAVPEASGASTVWQAKEALKPEVARDAQDRSGVKRKNRQRRRNAGFVRQGEWFFIPVPEVAVEDWMILHNEPLRRGRGKAHMAEFAYRIGGERVHVSAGYRNGLTDGEFARLRQRSPDYVKKTSWTTMVRNPELYVMGRIRHPDHKTIHLRVWHRVVPNTEDRATASRNVAFLD